MEGGCLVVAWRGLYGGGMEGAVWWWHGGGLFGRNKEAGCLEEGCLVVAWRGDV